jgi:hypothetical protein
MGDTVMTGGLSVRCTELLVALRLVLRLRGTSLDGIRRVGSLFFLPAHTSLSLVRQTRISDAYHHRRTPFRFSQFRCFSHLVNSRSFFRLSSFLTLSRPPVRQFSSQFYKVSQHPPRLLVLHSQVSSLPFVPRCFPAKYRPPSCIDDDDFAVLSTAVPSPTNSLPKS